MWQNHWLTKMYLTIWNVIQRKEGSANAACIALLGLYNIVGNMNLGALRSLIHNSEKRL